MRRLAPIVGLLALAGCPERGELPDAGPEDAGLAAACGPDEPPADSGVHGRACDPVDGSRCAHRPNHLCVWDFAEDDARCTCTLTRGALGAICDDRQSSCGPGLACLGFVGQPFASCRQVCNLADGSGCEAITTARPEEAVACVPVRVGGRPTTRHGVCLELGTRCDPLDDRCPGGEACGLLGPRTVCLAEGSGLPGEPCEPGGCRKGALCVPLVDGQGRELGARCYLPCALAAPACPEGRCANVGLEVGLSFQD